MSNRAFLESVTISNNKTKEESYAIKIYDDYGTAILSVENAIDDDFDIFYHFEDTAINEPIDTIAP